MIIERRYLRYLGTRGRHGRLSDQGVTAQREQKCESSARPLPGAGRTPTGYC